MNAAASAAGVHPGRPLADVRAALPGIAIRPARLDEDTAALTALARWLGRYSPQRNQDGRDGAWIDITGAAHFYAGEAALLHDIVDRLGKLGITARVGLADTFGAAHALARWATSASEPVALATPGSAQAALATLPVAALRLTPDTVELLGRLGLKRIGLLYGLPRAALERRFRERLGPHQGSRLRSRTEQRQAATAAAVLLRLDQALGHIGEPQVALVETPVCSARLAFAEPLISHAGIMAAVETLAANLCRDLDRRCLGAARFHLSLYRSDGSVVEIVIGTSAPGRDAAHICRLFSEKLDSIDAGFGLDLVTLEAGRTEVLASVQTALAPPPETAYAPPPPHAAALLLDRLANRLGAGRVVRLAPDDSHIPERSERVTPALAAIAPTSHRHATRPAALLTRPPLLLVQPEPASVMAEIPDGAPVRLLWRRLARRITRAEGPERIAPEWWRVLALPEASRPATRDYYRLEDDSGAGYWVFRDGFYGERDDVSPRWFVQGVWA